MTLPVSGPKIEYTNFSQFKERCRLPHILHDRHLCLFQNQSGLKMKRSFVCRQERLSKRCLPTSLMNRMQKYENYCPKFRIEKALTQNLLKIARIAGFLNGI